MRLSYAGRLYLVANADATIWHDLNVFITGIGRAWSRLRHDIVAMTA